MKILTEKIKGNHFVVSTKFKKFLLGGKKAVRQMIEDHGGTWSVKPRDDTFNYYILGREMTDFALSGASPLRKRRGKAIAEQELIEYPALEYPEFIAEVFEHFSAMMTRILSEKNMILESYKINKPITEEQFAAFEKRLKRPIPQLVKEFYSIFGSMQILWRFRYPRIKHGITSGRNQWNYSYRDSHPGTIQFLPLSIIVKEKWHAEDSSFLMTENQKMLDYFSEYHMVALELSEADNPIVKLGTDHGIDFSDYLPMTFSDYIKFTFHTFGLRERGSFFPIRIGRHMSYADQLKRFQKIIDEPIQFDFDNMKARNELKENIKAKFRTAINNKDLDAAKEVIGELSDGIHPILELIGSYYLKLELAAIQDNEEYFDMYLGSAIVNYGQRFDFEYYESETSSNRFQDADFYKEQKNEKGQDWELHYKKYRDS